MDYDPLCEVVCLGKFSTRTDLAKGGFTVAHCFDGLTRAGDEMDPSSRDEVDV